MTDKYTQLRSERDALREAAALLADWAEHEVGADVGLTPGLAAIRAIQKHDTETGATLMNNEHNEHIDAPETGHSPEEQAAWFAGIEAGREIERNNAAALGGEPDLYWDADDPERFPATDLYGVVEYMMGEYHCSDLPIGLELQCARSMPNVHVRVTGYTDTDGWQYEIVRE